MPLCNRSLTLFQRRSMQRVGGMLGTCVALSLLPEVLFGAQHLSPAKNLVVGLLSTFPVVCTMIVIARYIAGETDEYLRKIVIQAILWGLGMVMVADTFLGYAVEYLSVHIAFGLVNMDIFVVTGIIALRIELWRNR